MANYNDLIKEIKLVQARYRGKEKGIFDDLDKLVMEVHKIKAKAELEQLQVEMKKVQELRSKKVMAKEAVTTTIENPYTSGLGGTSSLGGVLTSNLNLTEPYQDQDSTTETIDITEEKINHLQKEILSFVSRVEFAIVQLKENLD